MKGTYRKFSFSVLVLFLVSGFWSLVSYAEMSFEEAGEKARASHETSVSDMIYQQEDFKAIYFQNIQMIQLLQEIRDELKTLNARSGHEAPKS